MMRYLSAGESHGPCLTMIFEGLPAGLTLSLDQINNELARRQRGYGRGGRMKIEKDTARITAGVRFGNTLGSPVCMQIENRDWSNWEERMAAFGPEAGQAVTCPRPGHADLSGVIKYRHKDIRNILERASARETASKVAVGAVAKQLLAQFGVTIASHVTVIGGVQTKSILGSVESILEWQDQSELGCCDMDVEHEMKRAIDAAKLKGDTLGGVFEIVVDNLPVGLGSHVHWEHKLDGRIAGALMAVPAIKGVEFGIGFKAGYVPGSEAHDEILYQAAKGYYRETNRAGGIEGGITNGEQLIVRAVMKPIPTLMQPLESVDIHTKQVVQANTERSDVCAVPAAAVVGEAVVAFELARAFKEKFGGDSMVEMLSNFKQYQAYVREG